MPALKNVIYHIFPPRLTVDYFKWQKSILFLEPEQIVEVISLNTIDILALEAGDSAL